MLVFPRITLPAWRSILAVACLLGCDQGPTAGGGGTDVPDAFHARLEHPGGSVANGAVARVRPASWVAGSPGASAGWSSVSGPDGQVTLVFPDTGRWTLEVLAADGDAGWVHTASAESLKREERVVLGPLGILEGRTGIGAGRVVLLGTERSTALDSAGGWRFDALPAGTWRPAVATQGRILSLPETTTTGPATTVPVAGRLLPAVGWTGAAPPISGWTVVDSLGRGVGTTDRWGAYSLEASPSAPMRLVATSPDGEVRVSWDAVAPPRGGVLPVRAAAPWDSGDWIEIHAGSDDGIRQRVSLRLLSDESGGRVVGNVPSPDTGAGGTAWSDDSGRFAAPRAAGPGALRVVDPARGFGAAARWDDGPPMRVVLAPARSASARLRFPEGVGGDLWGTGHSATLLGAGGASVRPVLPGGTLDLGRLWPGRYALVLVSLETGRRTLRPFSFEVGAADLVLDADLAQDHFEDTAAWSRTVQIAIPGPADGPELHAVPVRLDLSGVLDFDSPQRPDPGGDFRVHGPDGRWIPHELSVWDAPGRRAEAWVLMDTLAPGRTRRISFRFGNPLATRSGLAGVEQVQGRAAGARAFHADARADDLSGKGSPPIQADATTIPGERRRWMWGMEGPSSLRARWTSGAAGARLVFRLDTVGTDSVAILSLGSPSGERVVELVSVAGRPGARIGGRPVVPSDPSPLPTGRWLVANLRRVGDSVRVVVDEPAGGGGWRMAGEIPSATGDSLELVVGNSTGWLEGFAGAVEEIALFDRNWTEDHERHDLRNRAVAPSVRP